MKISIDGIEVDIVDLAITCEGDSPEELYKKSADFRAKLMENNRDVAFDCFGRISAYLDNNSRKMVYSLTSRFYERGRGWYL